MIELAPGHKQGLPSPNPVWIAGGIVGYGEAIPNGLELSALGGVVIGPITAASRAGASLPRVAYTPGGMVLETGMQNRGIQNAISRHSKVWSRIGAPVVAQIADRDASGMAKLASRMASVAGIAGLELLPLTQEIKVAIQMVRLISQQSELPVWVKLPLAESVTWAKAVADAGANAVVIGQPLRGRLGNEATGSVYGNLYGPLTFAVMFSQLRAVAQYQLPVAVIACGGIHTVEQMNDALNAGASAVQVDTAVWVEPALPNWLATAWQGRMEKRGA